MSKILKKYYALIINMLAENDKNCFVLKDCEIIYLDA